MPTTRSKARLRYQQSQVVDNNFVSCHEPTSFVFRRAPDILLGPNSKIFLSCPIRSEELQDIVVVFASNQDKLSSIKLLTNSLSQTGSKAKILVLCKECVESVLQTNTDNIVVVKVDDSWTKAGQLPNQLVKLIILSDLCDICLHKLRSILYLGNSYTFFQRDPFLTIPFRNGTILFPTHSYPESLADFYQDPAITFHWMGVCTKRDLRILEAAAYRATNGLPRKNGKETFRG